MRRSRNSSNDSRGIVNKYLRPAFWVNPDNHFWESPRYTERAKAYFRANVVEVARVELERKAMSDGIIQVRFNSF